MIYIFNFVEIVSTYNISVSPVCAWTLAIVSHFLLYAQDMVLARSENFSNLPVIFLSNYLKKYSTLSISIESQCYYNAITRPCLRA